MQGNCSTPPPSIASFDGEGPDWNVLRGGQCVLIFDRLGVSVRSNEGNAVWMHNLYLRAGRPALDGASSWLLLAVRWATESDLESGPRVYLTDVSLQGNAQATVGGLLSSTRIFVRGVLLFLLDSVPLRLHVSAPLRLLGSVPLRLCCSSMIACGLQQRHLKTP
jgi:hypothetical protein